MRLLAYRAYVSTGPAKELAMLLCKATVPLGDRCTTAR